MRLDETLIVSLLETAPENSSASTSRRGCAKELLGALARFGVHIRHIHDPVHLPVLAFTDGAPRPSARAGTVTRQAMMACTGAGAAGFGRPRWHTSTGTSTP